MKFKSSSQFSGKSFTLPSLLKLACTGLVFLGLGHGVAQAQVGPNAVYFVINNQTGLDNDAVFVSLQGATGSPDAWGGNASSLSANTSYSLAQLLGTLPGGTGAQTTNVPIISSTTMNGGYFDFTLGQAVNGANPATNIVNGRFEVNVQTQPTGSGASSFYNTNVDVSYVNSLSLPMSFSILSRADNTVVPLVNQLSTVSTTSGVWTSINNSAAIAAAGAIVPAGGYAVQNSSGMTIGTMTGNASALAPGSGGTTYHDWLTNASPTQLSLLNTLEGASTSLNTSSYTVPSGAGNILPAAEWTFSAVTQGSGQSAPYSPFNHGTVTTDTDNRFLTGQGYTTTSAFTTDMNPSNNPDLAAAGIAQGTAGVIISGYGGNGLGTDGGVGNFTIYVTNTSLNQADGIYGSNPTYVVEWTSFTGSGGSSVQNGVTDYVTQQNSNNLVDRVVGDLTAGITFGWATGSDTVSDIAAAFGKESALNDSVFSSTYSGGGVSLADTPIDELSASQYFYLLSVLGINGEGDDSSGSNIAAFSGSSINPDNNLFYDNYGDAIVAYTDAYAYPYSDRLQGYSPDIFPMPATGSETDANNQYIYITLLPGDYTFNPVPEPSTYALLLMGGVVVLVAARKRRQLCAVRA